MFYRLLCAISPIKLHHTCSRRAILHVFRAFSDFPGAEFDPLRQWTLTISPFTKIKCHVHCDISIQPLDPHSFLEADRAIISVHGPKDAAAAELDTFQVHYVDQNKELTLRSERDISNVSVKLTAPVKSDLHVVTRGNGSVRIQNMESDHCQIWTERGHCLLQSIKSHKVQVCSSGGNITGAGTIHGDVDIITGEDGSVDIKKIQGTSMNVSTDHGLLKVKAVYAESCVLTSTSGKIHIGHLHGEARMQSDSGDIITDSSSHVLTARTNTGNIDAYVSQSGAAELHTQQGSVSVRVPTTLKAWVQLSGATVDINSEITQRTTCQSTEENTVLTAQLNGGTQEDCWIKATAVNGTVNLKTQSWLETLKLEG